MAILQVNLVGAAMAGGISIDADKTFVLQMVLFIALVPILKWALFDPVLKVFEERERRTDGARAEARQMQEQAGELLRRYESELEKIGQVASEERERLRAETAKLEAEILAEARKAVAEVVAAGRARIGQEVGVNRTELGAKTHELASAAASRVLGREVP